MGPAAKVPAVTWKAGSAGGLAQFPSSPLPGTMPSVTLHPHSRGHPLLTSPHRLSAQNAPSPLHTPGLLGRHQEPGRGLCRWQPPPLPVALRGSAGDGGWECAEKGTRNERMNRYAEPPSSCSRKSGLASPPYRSGHSWPKCALGPHICKQRDRCHHSQTRLSALPRA